MQTFTSCITTTDLISQTIGLNTTYMVTTGYTTETTALPFDYDHHHPPTWSPQPQTPTPQRPPRLSLPHPHSITHSKYLLTHAAVVEPLHKDEITPRHKKKRILHDIASSHEIGSHTLDNRMSHLPRKRRSYFLLWFQETPGRDEENNICLDVNRNGAQFHHNSMWIPFDVVIPRHNDEERQAICEHGSGSISWQRSLGVIIFCSQKEKKNASSSVVKEKKKLASSSVVRKK